MGTLDMDAILAEELSQSMSLTELASDESTSSSVDGVSSILSSISGTGTGEEISDARTAESSFNDGESGRSSYCTAMSDSFESVCSNFGDGCNAKPHKANNDLLWEVIQAVKRRDGVLGPSHFRLLKRLGSGDIGRVYLAELRGTSCHFALKVMNKGSLASRKKMSRAQTETEILSSLDHPFLPTLYSHFETDRFSCLVIEYCSGGDLHMFRLQQPAKRFSESAVRFYASEILLALEYLHMMGVVYRDLKPENVLVRGDGHIMLSDFDLSLRCVVSPTIVTPASSLNSDPACSVSSYRVKPTCIESPCTIPACIQPSCFVPNTCTRRSKRIGKPKNENLKRAASLPELVAEPTNARSMSFVGTLEYLAPEIINGEGHGSAVDWWTFGIILYELLYGRTPFKGAGSRATLFNVAREPLRFPETPSISFGARDLIRRLLVKKPERRLASKRGATEIKQHPFFGGVNWALVRSTTPPEIPIPIDLDLFIKRNILSIPPVENKAVDSDSSPPCAYICCDLF